MELTIEDLDHLARGAAFLGAGGGGDPYLGSLLARHAIERHGPPRVIALDELADDEAVYPIAIMGAPTVFIEKLVGGPEVALAIEKLEEFTGRKAAAILPAEAGGFNSLLPVKLAATRQQPVVDADGMGRAFPEVQMVTFNVYGIPASPLVIANEFGEFNIISARDARSAEGMARLLTIQMGGGVAVTGYPMTGADAKRTAIPGTLTLALEIGRAIARGRRSGEPFEALQDCLCGAPHHRTCRILFEGKICDVLRETTQGFAIGRCRIRGSGQDGELEVTFQNENLVARLGNETRAIVPDLICILDRESAEPLTTEALRYGQRVRVVGVSVPPIMKTPEALAVFGPRAFGIEENFRPIESLS